MLLLPTVISIAYATLYAAAAAVSAVAADVAD